MRGRHGGARHARLHARQWLALELGQRGDARHLFHQIGLAQHIGAPAGHPSHIALEAKAQVRQGFALGLFRNGHAHQAFHARRIKAIGARHIGHRTRHHHIRRGAATKRHDHRGGIFQRLHIIGRVNAAFVAIARIRVDFQRPPRGGDLHRVPHRRFQEHVHRVIGAAGGIAPHNAGNAFHPMIIGNHHHAGAEFIGFLVEPYDGFAACTAVNTQIALHLICVENMQGAVAVIGEEIGHIDQRRNRAQANGAQLALQPFGAGAVFHPTDQPPGKHMAAVFAGVFGNLHPYGAGKCACNRGGFHRLQLAQPPRGQIAGNAAHAQGIGAVGGDGNFNHRVHPFGAVCRQPIDKFLPHLARGQFDDAIMFVR